MSLDVTIRRHDGATVQVQLRTVPVVRGHRIIAIEGCAAAKTPWTETRAEHAGQSPEPAQQRLVALLYEVHDLLHGALPSRTPMTNARESSSTSTMRLGEIIVDIDRMVTTLSGKPVTLTSRELLLLRYLLQRRGRVVTRKQLLTDVWGYRYTGDDRTVDVHISRLRRKLPPLHDALRAVKHIGYQLIDRDAAQNDERRVAKS